MLIINPANGEILQTDDPSGYYALGYRDATPDELDHAARVEEFGGFEQQAQAQVERVVRGATLGAVEGFGTPEENRARAEVSEELSPVTSFAANVLPDVGIAALTGGLGGLTTGAGRAAARASLAEGAGLLRAGLAAGRAGGAAALAAESVGTGAVGASQQAYAEGREFLSDDPGADAENALIWGGLNFGLGAFMLRRGAGAVVDDALGEGGEIAAKELDDVAAAAEVRAAAKGLPEESIAGTPGQIFDVEGAAPGFVPLETQLDDGLAAASSAPVELTEQEAQALNNGKSSLGFLERPRGPLKDALASALEKTATDSPGTLYRGMRLSEDELQGIVEGGYATERYTPTSADRRAAELFAGGTDSKVPVLMQLDGAPRASMAHGFAGDAFPAEQMAILPPGQRYKVVSVEDVTIPPEKDWMQPQPGKLLRLQGEGAGSTTPLSGTRRVEAGAVRQGEREAVEGGVERALRNASKSDAADIVERAIGPAPAVEREADSFGRQRRLYTNRKAIRQVATREMQQDLTELVENVRQVASVEKQSAISGSISDNLPAQRAVANGIAKDAAQFVGELKAEARSYGAAAGKKGLQYAIPGQRDLALALMDHAKEIAKAPDGKALFEALDGFKRAAQEHKLALEKGLINSESPLHYEKLIPRVEEFARKIRGALEDSGTWGRAGEMQRAYNSVISERLIPNMKQFESAVLKRTHQGYDGLWKTEGWETKIRSLLADADGGNRRHVLSTLDAMDELAGVARKYGDVKQADAIAGKAAKVRRTIGLADEVADAEERMRALGNIMGGGPMGGAFAGALMGGLPGAAIGAALPGAVRGFVMGDLVEAFQRLSGATDAAVKRGVDDWIRSSRMRAGGIRAKLPKLPTLSDEAKQLRDVAMRRGITQSMALFMGEDSTPHAAYKRLQDSLLDGEKFFNDLSKEYGTLQRDAPDVFMMLAARADGDRRYLIQRMPPNVAVSMSNPDGYPPSRDAIEDWATYVNALRYPMRVARSIGSMRPQEAEALRERRPRVYELLQQRVIEGIQEARRSGEQVDDVALAKINLLFPDVDGLASPVFSRELGQVVADYNLAKRERERGGGSPSAPPDKRGQLPAQAMAQQGATFGMRG